MHVTNSHPLAFFEIGLKLKVLLMWICLGFFFQLFGANGEADRGWLLIKEKNGVKVYEKELDDRIAFRGVGIIQGKPEVSIYIETTKSISLDKSRTIAIGDSIFHDIKGANNFGINSVLVKSGIHKNDHTIEKLIKNHQIFPTYLIDDFNI